MKTKVFLAVIVITISIFATACPKRTAIGDISANPSKYYDSDVAIAGTVKNSYGLSVLGGVYKIDDGSGSIWVFTKKSVPSKNSQVGVKGRIQDGVNFNGKNYGLGLIEDERVIKKK